MGSYEGVPSRWRIGVLHEKYNANNEDTTLVATVSNGVDTKTFFFSRDPLHMLISEASEEIEEYCDDEWSLLTDEVDITFEWPADIKQHRGDAGRSNQEAVIIPFAVDPDARDVDYYKEDDQKEYYNDLCNCLVRIHWSDGRIEDVFIDADLAVHDFGTMDKSALPECDQKSFEELIEG